MERIIRPTERGQVTIPKAMRDALHIDHETPLTIRQDATRIIIEPLSGFERLARQLAAEALRQGLTPDALTQEVERVRQELWDQRVDHPAE